MRGFIGILRFATVIIGGGIVVAFTFAALGPRIAELYAANESTTVEIDLEELALRTIVYDANGDQFDVLYGEQNRQLVELEDVSPTVIEAVIAIEDEGFYEHTGIDAKAIARAFIRNVNAGGIEEGGSTITQQLVKNAVVGNDQNVDRKIAEAALARRLERQFTKDEILEKYLNTVYFGGGAYGIVAAAEIYFGTTPAELDYAQAALLAGLIQNPSRFDPTLNPNAARDRREVTLRRLVATGDITEEEADQYGAVPVPTSRFVPAEWQPDNYFIEEVRRRLLEDPRLGATYEARAEALFSGGLRVYTTYDPAAYVAARLAVNRFTPVDDDRGFVGALASVEPGSGKVRAIIGGPGFEVDGFGEFNIATQGGRPTGSSFKAFVLAAAMEKGIVPSDQIDGAAPCEFDNPGGSPNPYRATNFGGGRSGSVRSVRSQTLSSSNCAYLRLGQIVGLSNVADTARALGVTSDLSSLPISMPLGPLDVTPLDMATAYATFANDGVQVDPIFIERVEDRSGNIIFVNDPNPSRAISTQSARLVTSVLEANVRGGTGTGAQIPGQTAAGKTGTGQSFKNAWFVGYTPYLATAVWMGNPLAEVEMRGVRIPELGYKSGVTGGSAPAAIWGAFNEVYHAGLEPRSFDAPGPTRSGRRLRTDDEEARYDRLANSLCGDRGSEVDEDGDGVVDFCEDSGFTFDPSVGRCPALLVPVDRNGDGSFDGCIPPTTTTTTIPGEPTTTTTTIPGEPPTTIPPTTSTTPPTTSTTTTTAPPPTTTDPPPTTTDPPPTTTTGAE